MLKFIVGSMKAIIEWTASLLIFGSIYLGYRYSSQIGGDTATNIFYACVGFFIGLFAAIIFLGVPALLLRINANLDELNKTAKRILDSRRDGISNLVREPHPLAAGFPSREPMSGRK